MNSCIRCNQNFEMLSTVRCMVCNGVLCFECMNPHHLHHRNQLINPILENSDFDYNDLKDLPYEMLVKMANYGKK